MPEKAQNLFNPFPGLRPFEPDETHLFFGRAGQSDELLRILARTRFVAVVGTSGSGKSSLVRAGMLPALQRGFLAGAGSNWRIAIMRPGAQPIESLAEALNDSAPSEANGVDKEARRILIDTTLRQDSLGLVEATRLSSANPDENLLVLVDQFEEIFRLSAHRDGTEAGEDEPVQFVRLLLEAIGQSEVPVYVTLTMRSDFLGDCARFRDLPETLNRAQYLIPRMTREQRREAIEGPVAVGGATISPALVQRLLNEVGDDPDQLPILQHALMRTWEAWRPMASQHESTNRRQTLLNAIQPLVDPRRAKDIVKGALRWRERVQGEVKGGEFVEALGVSESVDQVITKVLNWQNKNQTPPIDLEDYERSGGLKYALSRDAESAYRSLPDPGPAITRRLFMCLAEKGLDGRETRHPMRLSEICAIAEADQADVIRVVDWFRSGQVGFAGAQIATQVPRAFLTPPAPAVLGPDSVIDISHESLIRLWSRLRQWVDEEADSAAQYRRLANDAALNKVGKAALWRDPNLQLALDWRDRERPNQAWADRYSPGFVDAMDFLDRSRRARDRGKWLRRSAIGALGLLTVLAFALAWVALKNVEKAELAETMLRAQSRLVLAQKLAVQAQLVGAESPASLELSALLAVESVRVEPLPEGIATLRADITLMRKITLNAALDGPGNSVSFSPHGELLAVADGSSVRVIPIASGRKGWRVEHGAKVNAAFFSPNGRYLATASDDGAARMFDVNSGAEVSRANIAKPVLALAFSPDSLRIAIGGADGIARVFDAATGKQITQFNRGDRVDAVAFSPDGSQVAAGSFDNSACVFGATSGVRVSCFSQAAEVDSIAFSPERGLYLGVAAGNGAVLIRLGRQNRQAWRAGHEGPVRALAFSPQRRYLATASADHTARVFNVFDGVERSRLVHGGDVVAVAFDPDSRLVATASFDSTARIFEAETGREVARLVQRGPARAVAFSSDGNHLAITGDDKTARVYEVEDLNLPTGADQAKALISIACDRLTRNFTREEWEHYMSGSPYQKTCPNLL